MHFLHYEILKVRLSKLLRYKRQRSFISCCSTLAFRGNIIFKTIIYLRKKKKSATDFFFLFNRLAQTPPSP